MLWRRLTTKNKVECNRELLFARIYIATSARSTNNTSVMSVNIGHFDINFDFSFYNAVNTICLISSGKIINPKLTTRNMLMYSNHTHTRLTALFPGPPGWAGTRKVKPIWILLKQETVSGSGISWAICKSAPRSRQITMPVPHHSKFFTGRMPFLPPNQQRQSTEGTYNIRYNKHYNIIWSDNFWHNCTTLWYT